MAEKTEKTEVKEVKKEVKPQFELGQVATQHATVIVDNTTGDVLTEAQALVFLLNEVQQIKRLLG